jgi:hypothetical protein
MSSNSSSKAGWLKTLHTWHWISSAICLIGLLLFALTGITLNHASWIEVNPRVEARNAQLPAPLLAELKQHKTGALPAPLRAWLADALKMGVSEEAADWSPEEVYLAMPRPGGDAWIRIDRESGAVEAETTDRGWIAYLNDLHKGRHAGPAWTVFIDVFALACLLFAITGLLILKYHAAQRPGTWPYVGLGLLLPALIALLLIH